MLLTAQLLLWPTPIATMRSDGDPAAPASLFMPANAVPPPDVTAPAPPSEGEPAPTAAPPIGLAPPTPDAPPFDSPPRGPRPAVPANAPPRLELPAPRSTSSVRKPERPPHEKSTPAASANRQPQTGVAVCGVNLRRCLARVARGRAQCSEGCARSRRCACDRALAASTRACWMQCSRSAQSPRSLACARRWR